jgi:hypothetical protein
MCTQNDIIYIKSKRKDDIQVRKRKNDSIHFRIPQDMREWFIEYCRKRRVTMTQALTSYIESLRAIEEQEKKGALGSEGV